MKGKHMPKVITKPLELKLTSQEAYTLLRLIANANDDYERTTVADRQTGTWLAGRIIRLIEDEF